MKRYSLLLSMFAVALFATTWPGSAFAATLSFSAPASVSVGEVFSLDVRIDSGSRGFNAAEATLLFPKDILEVTSVDTAPPSTVFNFWLTFPTFSNDKGTVSFSGGTTQGIVGSAVQVFTVHMRGIGSGSALITASDASINASDGSGTNILENIITREVSVRPGAVAAPKPTLPAPPVQVPASQAPSPTPVPQGAVAEKNKACTGLFANCDLPFPAIEKVSVVSRSQTGSDIFVSGTAEAGTHVHLRLMRNGVQYKEITAIIQPGAKWEGVLTGIYAYGIYSVDATAEDVSNRSSQPVTWSGIEILPPYTLHLFGIVLRWYIVAEILLAAFVLLYGIFLISRRFLLRKEVRFSSPSVLVFLASVVFFIGMSVAAYFFWARELSPEKKFWKDTDVPCVSQISSLSGEYSSAHLDIFIDGVPQAIPANIGVSPQCVAQIHTHDDIGFLHFDAGGRSTTLSRFFLVAGGTLEQPGYKLSVTINGEDYTKNINDRLLKNGDMVVVKYTTIR